MDFRQYDSALGRLHQEAIHSLKKGNDLIIRFAVPDKSKTAIGGPFGFVAGTIIGFTAATIESAWDTWFPQFRASVNNFYNNIIYNISRYH